MKLRLTMTVLLMLAVAACGLVSRPAGGGRGDCPAPAADTQLLKNDEHGYCLLYPAGYQAEQPNAAETVLFTGSLLNVDAGRAYIEVTDAGGQTPREIAGGIIREIAASLPDWGVQQSALKLGGEAAIVLNNVPGQDLSRQVVAVHNGRLYRLTFVPADPAQSGAYQGMEKLYKAVVDSFRFLP